VTFGREIDEASSFALMDYAVEHGMNLFDTAEAYGGGDHSSEKIIGSWMRATGIRRQIVLITKITANFTQKHVREALATSLDRLRTDYLDIYLFHSFDPVTPLKEALDAMHEGQRLGLIRCAGCSNFSGSQLRRALELSRDSGFRLEVTEAVCNLAARESETDLLPICRDEEIGFLAYSPLGAGFLSGKYSGDRSALPVGSRFHVVPGHADIYFTERNFRTVARLHETAARWGVPALRLAVAWVLAHPEVSTVLCGARNTDHLANALAASETELASDWPVDLQPG